MYRHLVSLGGACDVVHNLRRVFGMKATHFFDWHVTSFEALTAAVAADLRGIGDKFQLRKNRSAAIDGVYGIQLQHAFPRGDDGLVAAETIAREQTNAKQKLRFLRRRWLATLSSGEPIMFVMRREVDQSQVDALHALLDAKTAGACHLRCLHFPQEGRSFIDRPGVSHAVVREGQDWRGDADSWDDALADIDYAPPDLPPEPPHGPAA